MGHLWIWRCSALQDSINEGGLTIWHFRVVFLQEESCTRVSAMHGRKSPWHFTESTSDRYSQQRNQSLLSMILLNTIGSGCSRNMIPIVLQALSLPEMYIIQDYPAGTIEDFLPYGRRHAIFAMWPTAWVQQGPPQRACAGAG